MGKQISEMTPDELRDYALELVQENATLEQTITDKDSKIAELTEDNALLVRRNNELFVKVEQGVRGTDDSSSDPDTVESCEEFASRIFKEVIN